MLPWKSFAQDLAAATPWWLTSRGYLHGEAESRIETSIPASNSKTTGWHRAKATPINVDNLEYLFESLLGRRVSLGPDTAGIGVGHIGKTILSHLN